MAIKVGIIGTGFGGRVHAPHFRDHPSFVPVAIASVHRGDVERIREASGIRDVFLDWRDLVDRDDLDLVVVASNPLHHREMTLRALAAGHHVVCEKPMAMDAQQAREMLAAQEASGRIGAITFEFRFRPARAAVERLLRERAIGAVHHIAFHGTGSGLPRATQRALGWLGDAAQGGGRLGALGSHMVDGVRRWLDDEFQEVTAQLATHVPEPLDHSERRTADDGFLIAGRMRRGATCSLSYVSAAHRSTWSLEVHGSDGSVYMRDDAEVWLQRPGGDPRAVELPATVQPAVPMQAQAAGYYTALRPLLDELARSIESSVPGSSLPTFRDGLEVQKVLDAARRSDRDGARVILSST